MSGSTTSRFAVAVTASLLTVAPLVGQTTDTEKSAAADALRRIDELQSRLAPELGVIGGAPEENP